MGIYCTVHDVCQCVMVTESCGIDKDYSEHVVMDRLTIESEVWMTLINKMIDKNLVDRLAFR